MRKVHHEKIFNKFVYIFAHNDVRLCWSRDIIKGGEVSVAPHYLTDGRNYTFAIYNNANQLVTHPVKDWLKRTKEVTNEGKPYTDIFVVSHGWNFTITEAISNYHKYIKVIDDQSINTSHKEFRPYFIFVVWESVSRPVTHATQSILPYGLAEFIYPLASTIDSVAFQIPSGWKESIDAYHNALGRDLPVYYLEKENSRKENYNTSNGGRNLPVSEVMYEIFSENEKKGIDRPFVHAIGHSYGTKLIALSTLAALHKYEIKTNKLPDNCLESLVLFNAAFHPRELNYVYGYPQLNNIDTSSFDGEIPEAGPERYFKSIPRKAVVYSNADYATGFIFGIGQIILNGYQAQTVDSTLEHYTGENGPMASWPKWTRTYIVKPISGGIQLPYNVATSSLEWSFRKISQLPTEWWHHVKTNDTFGGNLFSKTLNAVHFFTPFDKLLNEDVDHQGIFRTTIPALGRSGLHNQKQGHFLNDLGAIESFVYDKEGNPHPTTQINSETFAKMACETNWGEGSNFNNPQLMYSFDASTVYDSLLSVSGSHVDLRSEDEIMYCIKKKLSSTAPQKITGTFNFVLKFIHGLNVL